ncbi:MAG: hypothetical protein ACRDL7_00970, partial [Gaiellaceae bacterium]
MRHTKEPSTPHPASPRSEDEAIHDESSGTSTTKSTRRTLRRTRAKERKRAAQTAFDQALIHAAEKEDNDEPTSHPADLQPIQRNSDPDDTSSLSSSSSSITTNSTNSLVNSSDPSSSSPLSSSDSSTDTESSNDKDDTSSTTEEKSKKKAKHKRSRNRRKDKTILKSKIHKDQLKTDAKYKAWHHKLDKQRQLIASGDLTRSHHAQRLVKRYEAKINRRIKEKSKQLRKRYLKRHQRAAKLTRNLTSTLKDLGTLPLKTNIDAEKRRRHFQQWITKIRRSFDQYPHTSSVFKNFDSYARVRAPKNDEINLAIYNVVVNFLDSLTIKSMQHHYPDGVQLLRDLINLCNADNDEVGDELKREFDMMKISSTETGSNFIIRAKAKANDARYHLKTITDEEIYKKVIRGIGRTHDEYGSLIMSQASLPTKKQNLRHLEKTMSDFDRERHQASPSKREFAGNTKTHQQQPYRSRSHSTDKNKTASPSHRGYCEHCGFYGHQESACKGKTAGKPKATDDERRQRKLFCKICQKPGLHDTANHEKGKTHTTGTAPALTTTNKTVRLNVPVIEHELGLYAQHQTMTSSSFLNTIITLLCTAIRTMFAYIRQKISVNTLTPSSEYALTTTEEHAAYACPQFRPSKDLPNWLFDSGATAHMTPHLDDLENITPCDVIITLADGSEVRCHHAGECAIDILDNDNNKRKLCMGRVLYIP